jgi:hypothetical protein
LGIKLKCMHAYTSKCFNIIGITLHDILLKTMATSHYLKMHVLSRKCSSVGSYHGHYWRGQGSNFGFLTSPQLKCVSLATKAT